MIELVANAAINSKFSLRLQDWAPAMWRPDELEGLEAGNVSVQSLDACIALFGSKRKE